MRYILVVVALAFALAVSAEELTVPEVIAAHRASAPVEGILRLVQEASSVAALAAADLERLHAAGVPEAVIAAMVARHAPPSPTATPTAFKPDDARLEDVVRLMKAGLSDTLVCEQIRRSGERYAPNTNDIVFLKEHSVPETVIATLIETGAPPTPSPIPTAVPTTRPAAAPTPLPTATPAVALVFEPLVQMTGAFRKAQAGRLVLTAENLEWSDARDPTRIGRVPTSSLKAVWLATTQRGQGAPLVELRVRSAGGGDLTFRDVDASDGTASQVEALYRAIRERFPQVVLTEKSAR
ncbi:MAG: hypothetical protein ABR961_12515 [Thermoanaerobaculaceae bacterium]|jgi:hypothetical protein